MQRRALAFLLTALPLAAFCLAVPAATAADTPTPQPASPTRAVDAALKAQGDAVLAEAQGRAQAGDTPGTLERLKTALDLYRRAGDADGQAGTLFYFALFYRQQQDYAAALDYYRRAQEAGRQLNSPLFDAGTFLGIGDMQALRKQQAEAVDSYTQALALLRQLGDRANQRIALTARGNSYYALGRYAEAAGDYVEALAIARDLKDAPHELLLLTVLGSAYKASGQLDQAMHYYPQALDAARASGDRAAEVQNPVRHRLDPRGSAAGERLPGRLPPGSVRRPRRGQPTDGGDGAFRRRLQRSRAWGATRKRWLPTKLHWPHGGLPGIGWVRR